MDKTKVLWCSDQRQEGLIKLLNDMRLLYMDSIVLVYLATCLDNQPLFQLTQVKLLIFRPNLNCKKTIQLIKLSFCQAIFVTGHWNAQTSLTWTDYAYLRADYKTCFNNSILQHSIFDQDTKNIYLRKINIFNQQTKRNRGGTSFFKRGLSRQTNAIRQILEMPLETNRFRICFLGNNIIHRPVFSNQKSICQLQQPRFQVLGLKQAEFWLKIPNFYKLKPIFYCVLSTMVNYNNKQCYN